MGKDTGISWCDATWNPWQGCHPVSEGCANCYMYRDKGRYGQDPTVVVRSSASTFRAPRRWKDPRVVFVCSWSDFFIEEADGWRAEAWQIMRETPRHTYLLLTKRVERVPACLPPDWPLANAWLGVTAENQRRAEERVPQMLAIPAMGRFVSVEPMLGWVWLDGLVVDRYHTINALQGCVWCQDGPLTSPEPEALLGKINWVIAGGETGPYGRRREMDVEWARALYEQCRRRRVAFFGKQMSGDGPGNPLLIDGEEVKEWPSSLRSRSR